MKIEDARKLLKEATWRDVVDLPKEEYFRREAAQLAAEQRLEDAAVDVFTLFLDMVEALEEAHTEAVEAEECWRIGCLRDQNHAATRSNRNVAVRVATSKALVAWEKLGT